MTRPTAPPRWRKDIGSCWISDSAFERTQVLKYSVIIPVYKAEQTLCRCVDSLLLQPHDDAEILLINDGSPDGSSAICNVYANKYSCVRYFEKENGGVSSARNYGLEHASGDYVLFVDSDDYVTPDFFSAIGAALAEHDYDLIQFSNYFTDGTNQTERIREPFQAKTREQLFPKLIETLYKKKSNQPWAKVYRRSLIEKYAIRFPETIEVGEDRAFYIHFSLYMSSFCVSDHPIYVVSTENEQSLSRKQRDDLDEQTSHLNAYLEAAMQRSDVPEAERTEYQKALNYDRLRMIYSKAKTLHKEKLSLAQRLKALHGYCRDLNRLKLAYPDSRYCRLTSLPVRRNLALLIDVMAWKLTH